MSNIVPILHSVIEEIGHGREVALCAVVATRGSTPQSPGAIMLVKSDYTTVGTLGGGCVEAEVQRRAFELLQRNQSSLLDFVLDHDYGWDDGLICGGRMDIGVMPISPGDDLSDIITASINPHAPNEPRTSVREDENPETDAPSTRSIPIRVQHEGRLIEYRVTLEESPHLIIAGAGHVGQALARIATDLDFAVTVIDDRAEFASPERFSHNVELVVDEIADALRAQPIDADTFVVIVTRGHQRDHQALDAVIRNPARYIGLIGSKRKTRLIYDDLRSTGVPQKLLDRVKSPIGLNIDAILVPEIAISIAAELIQTRRATQTPLVQGPFEIPPSP